MYDQLHIKSECGLEAKERAQYTEYVRRVTGPLITAIRAVGAEASLILLMPVTSRPGMSFAYAMAATMAAT